MIFGFLRVAMILATYQDNLCNLVKTNLISGGYQGTPNEFDFTPKIR
jgi:hypothetical protein